MTAASVETLPWSRRRWWGMVVVIFAAQLGLIFWLGDRRSITTHASAPAPEIRLAGKGSLEWLSLDDPTLFALPHRRGFSGLAWLTIPSLPTQYFDWSEPPRWLSATVPRFGTIFTHSAETNDLRSTLIFERPVPEFSVVRPEPAPGDSCQSVVRLEGGLGGRQITTPITLVPQPSGDLLTNSEVQVVIDSKGEVVSVPILLAKSGSAEADKEALRIAGALRFNSVKADGPPKTAAVSVAPELTWGRLVFEWCTIPLPPTNAAGGP